MEKIKKKKTRTIIKRKINLNINNTNSILFPHLSNLNNLKSKKYFSTISSNSDIMKKALQNYRANSMSSNYQNQNEIMQMTNSTISTLSATKINQKIIKETKTKTCFNKLAPKLLHNASKTNMNNDTDEFKINNNKNIEIKKHKKIISEINPILNMNIDDDILDEEDSLDFDLNIDNNDLNKYNALTERNKNNFIKCININDINFNECLKLENLFNELTKDLENNKLDNFDNKIKIVTKFLLIFNDKFNQNLFITFDINSLNNSLNQIILNNNINNNESIFLLIKEYLIQQLVFFYIIILISLIKAKHDRNIYLSGIQNLCFYFHQNFHVLNFILTSKINKNNIDLLGQVSLSFYKKCMIMVNENKTWLNDNNFMKCLKINNKLSKQVIKNLFEQLRIHFNNNNYRSNNNSIKRDKNKIYKNNKSKSPLKNKNNINNTLFIQKDYIESVINLLLEYIKSYKNVKFTNIIKDLKLFPPINYLLEKANIKLEKKTNINNLIVSTIKKKNNKDIINKERNILTEINKEKEINPPFLPKKEPKYKYSLILDLDETIVHYIKYKNSEYVQVRPYLDDFIKELSDYYEIIIFTASYQNYADLAINGIDIDKRIKYRLYRQHTMKIGNTIIKDLSKLGRDLKKIIIIDNCSENYSLQPKNGINLIDFTGNNNDDILLYLKKDLIDLYKKNPDDVRPYLKQIQINMNKRANELINLNKNKNLINLNKIQHNKKVIKDKIFEVIHENDNEINYS